MRTQPGKVRIIAGSLRGSKLAVPANPELRPTPDRVRETLFNWLTPVIEGSRCLDLYAGTGALGIEAASRGAGEVALVERDAGLASSLRENLARLKVTTASVVVDDALRFLDRSPTPYDIVFLDPPFPADLWTTTARKLEAGPWLAPTAWIYVESPRALVPELPATWAPHREGDAGEVRYALYRRTKGE